MQSKVKVEESLRRAGLRVGDYLRSRIGEGRKIPGLEIPDPLVYEERVAYRGGFASARLQQHTGFYIGGHKYVEDLPALGFFAMRLGIQGRAEREDNELIADRRELWEKSDSHSSRGQVFNSKFDRTTFEVHHAYGTRNEYISRVKEDDLGSKLLKDFTPETLAAVFDIEPTECAKVVLLAGFSILTGLPDTALSLEKRSYGGDDIINPFFAAICESSFIEQYITSTQYAVAPSQPLPAKEILRIYVSRGDFGARAAESESHWASDRTPKVHHVPKFFI